MLICNLTQFWGAVNARKSGRLPEGRVDFREVEANFREVTRTRLLDQVAVGHLPEVS
jgi:hypothetical protein